MNEAQEDGRKKNRYPPKPCDVCGNEEALYRGYLKQWICDACRKSRDQLVITMNNAVKQHNIPKIYMIAAHTMSKDPPGDTSFWTYSCKGEEERVEYIRRFFKGPFQIFTMTNPYGSKNPPMRLVRDEDVRRLVRFLNTERSLNKINLSDDRQDLGKRSAGGQNTESRNTSSAAASSPATKKPRI